MQIILPTDCGNAPRINIVGEFIVNWAKANTKVLSEWLTEEASWTIIGQGTHDGPQAAQHTSPPFTPERLEVAAIITHGRLASCDGYLETGDRRIHFNHSIRFAGAVKTSKIVQIRSYCIETHA